MAFQEEDPPGAPEWIVTFSDMISLLVTFFVLLLSFASITAKNEPKMRQFLRGMWGVFPAQDDSAVEGVDEVPTPDRTYRVYASLERHSRPFEVVLSELEQVGRREDDERLEIDLSAQVTGIRLAFGEDAAFAPADDRVNAALESALVRTASVVSNYPFEIVVEGHADRLAGSDGTASDADGLALARARAGAEVLTRSGAIDPLRVSLAGLGVLEAAEARLHGPDRRIVVRLVPMKPFLDGAR